MKNYLYTDQQLDALLSNFESISQIIKSIRNRHEARRDEVRNLSVYELHRRLAELERFPENFFTLKIRLFTKFIHCRVQKRHNYYLLVCEGFEPDYPLEKYQVLREDYLYTLRDPQCPMDFQVAIDAFVECCLQIILSYLGIKRNEFQSCIFPCEPQLELEFE